MTIDKKYEVPVLLIIFNRPDTTEIVFNRLREIKPSRLFVAADGPREKEGEAVKCSEARAVIDCVDWDCDVQKLYREENLGCRRAVSSAISWFFSNVEEGIILEDDCLPDPTFFNFCQVLLEKYRNDTRIMMISGNNYQSNVKRGKWSYYFSKYPHIWGWATWRRVWDLYDVNMSTFEECLDAGYDKYLFENEDEYDFWIDKFKMVYLDGFDTWDFQFTYTMFSNNGLSVLPNENLVSNIGFREDATHTVEEGAFANMPVKPIDTITHPPFVVRDIDADIYTLYEAFKAPRRMLKKSIFGRFVSKILS